MVSPRVRPVFDLELDADPDRIMERLRSRLASIETCTGVSVGRHAELFVDRDQRRLWSPHLSVTADHRPGGRTRLHARFGPHPQLWTFCMFVAFGLGFALLLGLTWSYAQWVMGEPMLALLTIPVVAVLGVALYLASLAGQHLGRRQMALLREVLERLVGDPD